MHSGTGWGHQGLDEESGVVVERIDVASHARGGLTHVPKIMAKSWFSTFILSSDLGQVLLNGQLCQFVGFEVRVSVADELELGAVPGILFGALGHADVTVQRPARLVE